MFKKSGDMISEEREAMRGGEGTIIIKHLFQTGDLKGKSRLMAEVTVPVGGSIGFHRHENEEEIYYFMTGQGEVDDDGEKRTVNPGDAMITGGGRGHAVFNTGNEPLRLFAVILTYA